MLHMSIEFELKYAVYPAQKFFFLKQDLELWTILGQNNSFQVILYDFICHVSCVIT